MRTTALLVGLLLVLIIEVSHFNPADWFAAGVIIAIRTLAFFVASSLMMICFIILAKTVKNLSIIHLQVLWIMGMLTGLIVPLLQYVDSKRAPFQWLNMNVSGANITLIINGLREQKDVLSYIEKVPGTLWTEIQYYTPQKTGDLFLGDLHHLFWIFCSLGILGMIIAFILLNNKKNSEKRCFLPEVILGAILWVSIPYWITVKILRTSYKQTVSDEVLAPKSKRSFITAVLIESVIGIIVILYLVAINRVQYINCLSWPSQ